MGNVEMATIEANASGFVVGEGGVQEVMVRDHPDQPLTSPCTDALVPLASFPGTECGQTAALPEHFAAVPGGRFVVKLVGPAPFLDGETQLVGGRDPFVEALMRLFEIGYLLCAGSQTVHCGPLPP